MRFAETELAGAFVLELERRDDERGFFARTWSRDEFEAHGLDARVAQCSVAYNERRGTLRGLHYQADPHAEAKLVRCTNGGIYDVIVDLRPSSPTRARWLAVELTADSGRMLYVPPGFAHGYQTLADATTVDYVISVAYEPTAQRGVRWDDPAFAIEWPEAPGTISERDRSWPDFEA